MWLERAVETGFVVGTASCFLGGFLRVLQGGNITGGLVAMADSPLAGLFLAVGLGTAAHVVEATSSWLVGAPDRSKLQAHETLSKTDSLAPPTLPEPPTDITATAGITKSPELLPDNGTYSCEPPSSPSPR